MRPPNRGLGALVCAALVVLQCTSVLAEPAAVADRVSYELFGISDIVTVAMSRDAQLVAFVVKRNDLATNRVHSDVFEVPADAGSAPHPITSDGTASAVAFAGSDILYLDTASGTSQIVRFDIASGTTQQLTTLPGGVNSFTVSPDGRAVAILSTDTKPTSAEKNASADGGFVVDKATFSIYNILENELFLKAGRLTSLYLLDLATGRVDQATHNENISGARWTPSSKSIVMTRFAQPDDPFSVTRVVAFNVLDKSERQYANPVSNLSSSILGVTDDDQALLYLTNWYDPYAPGTLQLLRLRDGARRSLPLPGWDLSNPAAYPQPDGSVLLRNGVRGEQLLYRLALRRSERPALVGESSGYSSAFAFSANGTMAYVHEDLSHPPEVYVSAALSGSRRAVTHINAGITWSGFRAEPVHWTAPDKIVVEGWLYRPRGRARYPLITVLHGGPSAAFNRYNLLDAEDFGMEWPFPLRTLASMGYGIFVPNYRGSRTYGRAFGSSGNSPAAAAPDINSGIDAMIREHGADGRRLGIFGHSLGATFAPYVVAHYHRFRAASFAEGGGSELTAYAEMPGFLNIRVHERYGGVTGTPYNNLAGYIAMSPNFTIAKARTPIFLEAVAQSSAISDLDYLTPLWREKVPHEMIIYPAPASHILGIPKLDLESATREIDWFDYWMLDRAPTSSYGAGELQRWAPMRAGTVKLIATP